MLSRTKLVAVLMMIGLAAGMYTATSGPAGAASTAAPSVEKQAVVGPAATQTFKNEDTRDCLDAHSWGVFNHPCIGSSEQKWYVRHWDDGTVRLRNAKSGQCLDERRRMPEMRSCDSSRYQSWWVKRWNDGTIRFKNQATGECLEGLSNGALISDPRCDSSQEQSWY